MSELPLTHDDAPPAAPNPAPSWASVIGKLAVQMQELGNGDLAALRRVEPDAPYTPTLWRLLLQLHEDRQPRTPDEERAWAMLLQSMALGVGLHDLQQPLGRTLAANGYSELRLVRLLRAQNEALLDELRRLSRWLATQGARANWVDLAMLLLLHDREAYEKLRLSIARSYYSELYKQQK